MTDELCKLNNEIQTLDEFWSYFMDIDNLKKEHDYKIEFMETMRKCSGSFFNTYFEKIELVKKKALQNGKKIILIDGENLYRNYKIMALINTVVLPETNFKEYLPIKENNNRILWSDYIHKWLIKFLLTFKLINNVKEYIFLCIYKRNNDKNDVYTSRELFSFENYVSFDLDINLLGVPCYDSSNIDGACIKTNETDDLLLLLAYYYLIRNDELMINFKKIKNNKELLKIKFNYSSNKKNIIQTNELLSKYNNLFYKNNKTQQEINDLSKLYNLLINNNYYYYIYNEELINKLYDNINNQDKIYILSGDNYRWNILNKKYICLNYNIDDNYNINNINISILSDLVKPYYTIKINNDNINKVIYINLYKILSLENKHNNLYENYEKSKNFKILHESLMIDKIDTKQIKKEIFDIKTISIPKKFKLKEQSPLPIPIDIDNKTPLPILLDTNNKILQIKKGNSKPKYVPPHLRK